MCSAYIFIPIMHATPGKNQGRRIDLKLHSVIYLLRLQKAESGVFRRFVRLERFRVRQIMQPGGLSPAKKEYRWRE